MKKFEFNEVTYASIYQLYNIDNEMDMNSATILLKKGLILKFIKMFVHSKPMFINSNFIWEYNKELNISSFNDLSLLVLQKEINSMFQLDKKCESKKNAYGLLKIWIKIMQEDEQINGDLRNFFSKDYVFNPNPESMNRHIAEVETEISENPLSNLIFTEG
jgi:hypothetical protein